MVLSALFLMKNNSLNHPFFEKNTFTTVYRLLKFKKTYTFLFLFFLKRIKLIRRIYNFIDLHVVNLILIELYWKRKRMNLENKYFEQITFFDFGPSTYHNTCLNILTR